MTQPLKKVNPVCNTTSKRATAHFSIRKLVMLCETDIAEDYQSADM